MSFICDICHKSTNSLYSQLIAEIREKRNKKGNTTTNANFEEKSKMAHIECCTSEQIKQMLLSQAEDQIMFYKDVIDLINGVKEKGNNQNKKEFLNKSNNFEQKYGSFDEIRQGTSIDHNLLAHALISELKRKTT